MGIAFLVVCRDIYRGHEEEKHGDWLRHRNALE